MEMEKPFNRKAKKRKFFIFLTTLIGTKAFCTLSENNFSE